MRGNGISLSAEKKEICVKNTDSQASGIFLAGIELVDQILVQSKTCHPSLDLTRRNMSL